jgi:hypothetical protein
MLKQKITPRSCVKTSMGPIQKHLAETVEDRRRKVTAMLAGFRKARIGSEHHLVDTAVAEAETRTRTREELMEREMLREKNAAKEAKARMKTREELMDREVQREKTGEVAAEARADFVMGLRKGVHLQLQGTGREEKAMKGKVSGKKKHFAGHKKH